MARKPPKTTKVMYSDPGMPPLYWVLHYTDAKQSVPIDSSFEDALKGASGSSVGCHLSLCAKENKARFPHDFIMAAFTQSMCVIITKFFKKRRKLGGVWCDGEAVRYEHRMGKYVDLNDEDTDKVVIKQWPELADMQFTLYAPYTNKNRVRTPPAEVSPRGKTTGSKTPKLVKGALQRAVRAGLVSKPVADHLKNMATE